MWGKCCAEWADFFLIYENKKLEGEECGEGVARNMLGNKYSVLLTMKKKLGGKDVREGPRGIC